MPEAQTQKREIVVDRVEACHAKKDGHPYWKITDKTGVAYITKNGELAGSFELDKTYAILMLPGKDPSSAILYGMDKGGKNSPAPVASGSSKEAAPAQPDSAAHRNAIAVIKQAMQDVAKVLSDAAQKL